MTRIAQVSIVVLAQLLAQQAGAQQGGGRGATGGSAGNITQAPTPAPSPARATPTPTPRTARDIPAMSAAETNRVLSPLTYLNSGNYGSAMSAYEILRLPHDYITTVNASANANNAAIDAGTSDSQHFDHVFRQLNAQSDPGRQDAFLLQLHTNAFLHVPPQAQRPDLGAAGDLIRGVGQRGYPGEPTTAGGSRPTSGLEDMQTQALRDSRSTGTVRLELAAELVRTAQASGNNAFITRARAMESEARRDLDRINAAVIVSDNYRGHAFANDADAIRYVELRQQELDDAASLANREITRNPGSFTSRSEALVAEMRQAFDGTSRTFGGETDLLSAAQLARFAERVAASRAENIGLLERSAAFQATAGNQREGFGSYEQFAAYYDNLRQLDRRFMTHSIDEIPTTPRPAPVASNGGTTPRPTPTQGASGGTPPAPVPVVDNTPPRPIPTTPDYPVVSAADRARIAREAEARRAAEAAARNAAGAADRARAEAAAREAAERAAMVERARVADENHRIFADAQRRNASDNRFVQMSRDRFGPGAMAAFADGRTVTALQLLDIYRGYDPNRAIPPAMSLSSAGNSPSSVSHSLSLAGLDYRDPAVESLNEVLYQLTTRRRSPFDLVDRGDPARAAQQAYNAGSFDVRYNRDGRENFESGGYLAASLFDQEDEYLRQLTANGIGGIDAALAQPFNVVLTWGAGAYDLDLHMTGPLGEATTQRFHIYYAAPGDLAAQPFAALIKDCICSAGSEVVLTSALNRGGVYRVSVFNYGDQSATSTNLANASAARVEIVRGGTTQSVGNGTTIVGGRSILTVTVPAGTAGNTWVAAELDPRNGRITVPGVIRQNASDQVVP